MRDELIGDVVQILAHEFRLRTDAQKIIADTFDERTFPSRRHGADGIPGMASDETEILRLRAEFAFDASRSTVAISSPTFFSRKSCLSYK